MLTIKRNGSTIHTVKIGLGTVLTYQLMGEHKIDADWISAAPLDLELGDYVELGDEKFYLNLLPQIEKLNNFTYRYNAVFEGEVYKLFNKLFQDEGDADFTYFGSPTEFMQLLVDNMNSIEPGWTFQAPENIEPKSISFSEESCRSALAKIIEAFELEFRLVQKEIILDYNVGFNSLYQFEYGRNKGLYSLVRQSITEKSVITRLYGYGGSKNINFDYRNGKRRLIFQNGEPPKSYVEANIELYGVREDSITFENIFPKRTGTVSSSPTKNKIIDTGLDFNVNNYLLEGTVAKIVFKSGALSGYEFEINAYDHSTKTISFNDFIDSNDYVLPNDLNFPEPGDEYTLIDIKMPQSYIDAAEYQLLEATLEHLNKVKSPRAVYTLNIDEKFIRKNGIELGCGMNVVIRDTALGLEDTIRVFSISYPIVNPQRITAEIADSIPVTPIERIKKDRVKIKNEIITIDRTREENYRDAVRKIRQLQNLIFDPDGYFDTTNIRPGSIETLQLTVGANSQNFGLNNVQIEPNFEGDPNRIRISGGELVHFEIEIEGLGYVWTMDPNIINGLTPESSYYVYARCNKSALQGAWVVSTLPIRSEEEVGWYHFWLGILYPVDNGQRLFMFTKGMTFIVGDTIRTGTIQSLDGYNFFNLTEGKFRIGDNENWMDWGVTSAGQLTINGAIVSKMIFAEDAEIINLKVSSLRTALNGKRVEILESENSIKLYDQNGDLVLSIDDDIDGDQSGNALAGIRINNPANGDAVISSGNGHFSNGSGMVFYSPSSGVLTNASIVGLLRRKNSSQFGISAGVVGIDQSPPGESASYGGFFDSIYAGGVNIAVNSVNSNYTCTEKDTLISCYNTSSITINLPSNPKKGKWLMIRTNFNTPTQIAGNGKQIWVKGAVNSIALAGTNYSRWGRMHMLVWDGAYWLYNAMPAVGTE